MNWIGYLIVCGASFCICVNSWLVVRYILERRARIKEQSEESRKMLSNELADA
jgi:hypothetical protein